MVGGGRGGGGSSSSSKQQQVEVVGSGWFLVSRSR